MNLERLNNLRQLLIEHHDNGLKFDLKYWGGIYDPVSEEVSNVMSDFKLKNLDPNVCKTVCCACGLHAIKRPQDGLKLVDSIYETSPNVLDLSDITHFLANAKEDAVIFLEFDGAQGFDAAAKFYEIDYYQARQLFNSSYYYEVNKTHNNPYWQMCTKPTPLMVVAKIDYLLNNPDDENLQSEDCPYSYSWAKKQARESV